MPTVTGPTTVGQDVSSVDVVVTGTPTGGSGFFDPGTGYSKRLQASISGSDVAVNGVTYSSPTSMTVNINTVSAAAGPRAVTITNPDGQSTTSSAVIFSIVAGGPAPTLASIAPTSGIATGGTVTHLAGANFIGGATVTIGGNPSSGPGAISGPSTGQVTTIARSPGTLNDVTLINPDSKSATLAAAWFADFLDVPQGDPLHSFVETIFRGGITAGCGGGRYCRNDAVTRAQMAVFLLKAKFGSGGTRRRTAQRPSETSSAHRNSPTGSRSFTRSASRVDAVRAPASTVRTLPSPAPRWLRCC